MMPRKPGNDSANRIKSKRPSTMGNQGRRKLVRISAREARDAVRGANEAREAISQGKP